MAKYIRKAGKKPVEVEDQRSYFRMPSFSEILTLLGMIAGFLTLFFHSVTWVNRVDTYMAGMDRFKVEVIAHFQKIEGNKLKEGQE